MAVKRVVSHEVFGCRFVSRTKSQVVSTVILFALLIIFLFADSIVSNVSLHSAAFHRKQDSGVLEPKSDFSTQKKIVEVSSERQDSLVSSSVFGAEHGTGRFRRKPPEHEIFTSDELTKKFHSRVLEFFNQKCQVQFFMTWISPLESFGRREMLSVGSVFRAHPDGCLMILSRSMDSENGYRILKPLLDRGLKVVAVTPDMPFLVKNTPAEAWFDDIKSGKQDPGKIPLSQNLSNLMRLAVLYKYGGVYLDTDFIVLKSFKGLKNTIGAQSIDVGSRNWTRLNNAVLVFDMNHPLLFKFIEEFSKTFDGNKWGHNGPYMVSRVVPRVEGKPGYDFTILPPMAFYPVGWTKIGRFFTMPKDRDDSIWVEAKLLQLNNGSYGIHLWNKQSRKLMVEEGSVMGRLIKENCAPCETVFNLMV